MKILGVIGWRNSGKTTLIVELIERFTSAGLSVSSIKHAHHAFEIDYPGKDSYRHREAGAREVLVASSKRWALIHQSKEEEEPDLAFLLSRMSKADLVLVEGFKQHPHPKLEVYLKGQENPLLAPGDPSIIAIVTDDGDIKAAQPVLSLDDPDAVMTFVRSHMRL